MKQIAMLLLCCLLLMGCSQKEADMPPVTTPTESTADVVTQPTQTEPEPTEESQIPEVTVFTVYTPNENLDGFFTTEVQGDQLTPLDALIAAGVLNEDIEILSVTREDNMITVDFNAAFADLIYTMGSTGEAMIMGSVVNTFLSAHGAETMMITVEGQILESGHAIYDFPMGFVE